MPECLMCTKTVGRNSSKYCSVNCQQDYQFIKYVERWFAGKEKGYGLGQKLSHYIQRYLREARGDKCEKCGWCEVNPVTEKVPLEANHKDGNYKNCRPENLELICPNCHSLTSNFRALNKGKGREKRRKNAEVAQSGSAPLL